MTGHTISRPRISTRHLRSDAGMALPAALFALLIMAILSAGIWAAQEPVARSTDNREEGMRAMQLAEAGAAHAIGVLRTELADTTFTSLLVGPDGLASTEDDGRLTGYGLDSTIQIPPGGVTLGGGTYSVQIVNDPADTAGATLDTNERVLLRCVGVTPRGGRAVIDAVIMEAVTEEALPLILIDGPLTISGDPKLLGTCGGVHTNGDLSISGNVVVQEFVSSAGDINVSGSVDLPDGTDAPQLENQPSQSVEDIPDPLATHCADADYILQSNGEVLRTSDNTLHIATSSEKFGWKRSGTSPTMWDYSGSGSNPGTFCVQGNATISGNPGESSTDPISMSIIASGSIEISGNPSLVADSETGFLLLAGGDLKINGNPIGTKANYTGRMYARHQCDFSGNMETKSQIVCKNLSGGSGIKDLVSENKISGNPQDTFDCPSGAGGAGTDHRIIFSWAQRFGI